MPHRLMLQSIKFAETIGECKHPSEVIERLHKTTSHIVNVLGAWRAPIIYTDWESWKSGNNVFLHRSVPEKFFDDWLEQVKINGQSILAAKAIRDGTPFTWSEAMRELNVTGRSRWIFELCRKYGMRDGLCCPVGPWMLHYWSRRPLNLSPQVRANLCQDAVAAIERLMKLTERRRLGGAPERRLLSHRELEIMRLFALGSRPRQVAQHLGISEVTVRQHLKTAQKKLDARHPAHAVAIAIRARAL